MTAPNPTDASLGDRYAAHQARLAGMSFPNAVTRGDRAPAFTLQNASGRMVRLDELLARGAVVLTFHRGAWCPYCITQLRSLQQALPDLEALGASLVAVSPQLPDGSLALVDEHALTFEVLTDSKSRVASEYGIVFADAGRPRALARGRQRSCPGQRRPLVDAACARDLRDRWRRHNPPCPRRRRLHGEDGGRRDPWRAAGDRSI